MIRFQERRRLAGQICQQIHFSKLPGVRFSLNRFIFPTNTSPPVLFCPVPKTGVDKSGTTFLKRVFALANNRPEKVKWIERFNVRPVDDYKQAVMFFFTREPYSRMFSAYLDKLWAPNLQFWHGLGREVKEMVRLNISRRFIRCGHDVTFPEIIKYVIKGLERGVRFNSHFMPTHTFCEVCDYLYDYIGHMETFREDVGYILNAINITTTRGLSFDNDILRDSVAQAFYTHKFARQKCATKDEILLRTWRALQLRGLISLNMTFPVSPNITTTITAQGFQQLLHQAALRTEAMFNTHDARSSRSSLHRNSHIAATGQSSFIPKDREEQKQLAMTSAYSLVPLADRKRLSQLLRSEFELFGYPPQPESIFSSPPHVNQRIFDLNTV